MDHIDLGGMRWTGKPEALGTGNVILLGLFLVSDSSVPVKTEVDVVWLDCGEPGGVRYAGKTAVMVQEI